MRSLYETEVLVAGGGPAGLAAAIAARQSGLEVTLVDQCQPPIDKACGEGLMPDGLATLSQIGIEIPVNHAFPFSGICFFDGRHRVSSPFRHGFGYGVRRTRLHALLVARASELGVRMHWGTRVTGLSYTGSKVDGLKINDCPIRSRWIVAADGNGSRIRKWAGLDPLRTPERRFGFRKHFRLAYWSDFVEIHWSSCGEAYITPVAEDEICVALLTRDSTLHFDQAVRSFPELVSRLGKAKCIGREHGAVTPSCRLRCIYRDRLALIGEASGSVDAVTGEGLSMSFRQALALADAMKRGDLASYQAAHRRILRIPRLMASFLLSMDRNPRLRNRMFRACAAQPKMFPQLLAIHTGAISPFQLGISTTVSWGWKLLTA